MNAAMIRSLADHAAVATLGWSLVHFAWQAMIIAGLVALALTALHRANSNVRYLVACAGLVLMAIAPLATASYLCCQRGTSDRLLGGIDFRGTDFSAASALVADVESGRDPGGLQRGTTALADQRRNTRWAPGIDRASVAELVRGWLPQGVALWAAGVGVLSLRLVVGLRRVRRWRLESSEIVAGALRETVSGLAQRMAIRRPIRLLESARTSVPAVIGWLQPAVIVPASILSGLTAVELESLLAHELAHVRRHDYLVNLLQTIVETVLFYHPAVWWVAGVIRVEREHCCDDLAVAACGNRVALARALARLEELRVSPSQLAMAANRGWLLGRIQRIVTPQQRGAAPWWPAGVFVLGSLAVALSGLWLSVARAQSPAAAPPVETEPGSGAVQTDANVAANDYPIHKAEVMKVDSRTGDERQVMPAVRLLTRQDGEQREASLDMLYSNVTNYTFITARVAQELRASELGEIDFGPRAPQREPLARPSQIFQTSQSEIELPPAATTVTVGELTEPETQRKIVPYPEDRLWVPEHLAFYGVNRTVQKQFKVVQIERVELGVGPPFGPVNALVLNDENSDFGVLGRDWSRVPRGPEGEGLVWSAEGGFYFMALPDPKAQLEPGGPETGQIDGRQAESPVPTHRKEIIRHTYDFSRRESTGWITLNGAQVPVDAGVEQDGVKVYVTLLYDVAAVDVATGNVLWQLEWSKADPIWKTVAIAEWTRDGRTTLAVELFPVNGLQGADAARRLDLRTGKPLVDSGPKVKSVEAPADPGVRQVAN